MKEAVHFVIIITVFFCCYIVSGALPFALGFPGVSGGRGVEGHVSELRLERRNGTASTTANQN
jgi:hypothetical protein